MSKMEEKAYNALKENGILIFRAMDLKRILGMDMAKAYNLIKALKKKGIIKKAGKWFFALRGTDDFEIGIAINSPSYLSFWSALNYYGFSDQTSKEIFFASAKYSKKISNFKYVTLSKERFFGYTLIGGLAIAEKEKAIIDSLLFPKYSGGMKEIKKCLQASLGKISIEKLIDYAMKTKSKAVLRRLGFILETMGINADKLRKHIGTGYEKLDPSLKRKNNLNKKWLLDVN